MTQQDYINEVNLFQLIDEQDTQKLTEFIENNKQFVNFQKNGYNGLQYAALQNKTKVIPLFIPYQKCTFAKNGSTALMIAIMRNHQDISKLLVNCECGMQNQNTLDTALITACIQRNVELMKELYQYEAKLQNIQKVTALMMCVSFNITDMLKYKELLIQEVGIRDEAGKTALFYAIRNNRTEFIDFLKIYEQKVQDNENQTALMLAVVYNCNYIFQNKVQLDLELGMQDILLESALIKAIKQKSYAIALQLVPYELNLADIFGLSPLHHLFYCFEKLINQKQFNQYIQLLKCISQQNVIVTQQDYKNLDLNLVKTKLEKLSKLQLRLFQDIQQEKYDFANKMQTKSSLILFIHLNINSMLTYQVQFINVLQLWKGDLGITDKHGCTAFKIVLEFLKEKELNQLEVKFITDLFDYFVPELNTQFCDNGVWQVPLSYCIQHNMMQIAKLIIDKTQYEGLQYIFDYGQIKIDMNVLVRYLIKQSNIQIDTQYIIKKDFNGVRVNDILMLQSDQYSDKFNLNQILGEQTHIYQYDFDF